MADYSVDIQAKLSGFDKLDQIEKQINALKNESINVKIDIDGDSGLSKLEKQINVLKNKSVKVKVDTSGTDGIHKTTQEIQKTIQAQKQLSNFKLKLNTEGATAELSKLKSQIDRFTMSSFDDKQQSQVKQLETSYLSLSATLDNLRAKSKNGTLDVQDVEKYNTALKTTQNQVKILQNELSGMTTATQRMKFTSDMENWLKNNTKCTKQAKQEIEEYIAKVKSLGSSMTKGEFGDIQNQFKNLTSEMKSQGKVGKSWAGDFKRAFGKIFQFAGAYGLIQNVAFEVPRQMIQAVKDVNAAQIELTKVSDAPVSQLEAYWDEAAVSAQKYGATISDVISATADFSRLGFNLEQSKTLSDVATLYKNVGDGIDISQASSSIVSTLQAFDIPAEQAMSVIDKFNETGNSFAISSGGIGEALKRSASALSAGNNDLSQAIALITTANTVVQDEISVGQGLKTASLRLRGTSLSELESMGEDTDGAVESVSKLREELLALTDQKVDIQLDEDSYKSTYQILLEMSKVYDSMTDMNQAAALELMFGKRQANIGAAILTHGDLLEDVYNTAANKSDGSALAEQKQYEKSIQYSIDKFKAQFQELSTVTLESDLFKGFVDGGAEALDIITSIIDTVGILPTILGGAGIAAFVKNLD